MLASVRRTTPLVLTDDDLNLPPGDTWATFAWPAWVPEVTRAEIVRFWDGGSGPRHWRENARASYHGHPIFGQRVEVRERSTDRRTPTLHVGRWVPAWGNMGRLVLDDGSVEVASTCYWQPINFCRDLGDEDASHHPHQDHAS